MVISWLQRTTRAAKHALNRLYSTNSCANSEITALADSLKATPLIPARVTLG